MQNYNFIQRTLHKIILGNIFVNKSLFEVEKNIFYEKNLDYSLNQHIFITGLPRSGTTILLEVLHKTNNFASLTYEDMPFILAPNLYKKIHIKKSFKPKERMHKDGIFFDLQSPESFDEVFFKTFKEIDYNINLKIFLSLILKKYEKNRYLSKNNNNYKRIRLINSLFPNSTILITFRNPIQHAYSLLNQHQNFCLLQKENDFILHYMNYLGHNEFGLNYKFWNVPEKYHDTFALNHWLEQWLMFYKKILNEYENYKNVIFVCFDDFFISNSLIDKTINKLNIEKISKDFFQKPTTKKINNIYDQDLLLACTEIFDKIKIKNNL